jgi:hypothetical protein
VDFVVDGRSLRGILPDAAELVTPLNRPWLPTVPDAIEGLQGQRHTEGLAGERTTLLVCGGCGGLA